MTDWQTILAVLIVTAGLTGRRWSIIAIIAFNFIATMELVANPVNVAIADSIAAVALIFCGRRGQFVAAIYGIMIPIYPALAAVGFSNYAIYAIIDGLAIAQLFVAGRWDVGIGRAIRPAIRRSAYIRRAVAAWPYLARHVGISQAEGERS